MADDPNSFTTKELVARIWDWMDDKSEVIAGLESDMKTALTEIKGLRDDRHDVGGIIMLHSDRLTKLETHVNRLTGIEETEITMAHQIESGRAVNAPDRRINRAMLWVLGIGSGSGILGTSISLGVALHWIG